MFGRKRIKELEGQVTRWYGRLAETDLQLFQTHKELAAEKAKKKCEWFTDNECANPRLVCGGTWTIEAGHKVDHEAARIAALPKCGTTKKCPACGSGALCRKLRSFDLNKSHSVMRVTCAECGYEGDSEKPLFNPGVKGNK